MLPAATPWLAFALQFDILIVSLVIHKENQGKKQIVEHKTKSNETTLMIQLDKSFISRDTC